MTTLSDIEAAADALPLSEKRQLLLLLAARLRESGDPLPEPRSFTAEQISKWIKEDEDDMRRLRENE